MVCGLVVMSDIYTCFMFYLLKCKIYEVVLILPIRRATPTVVFCFTHISLTHIHYKDPIIVL